MAHQFALLFKFLLLTSGQTCLAEFFLLETQKVFVVATLLQRLPQLFQLLTGLYVGFEGIAISLSLIIVAGYDINYAQLEVLFAQQQVLMLAVYVNETVT